MIPLAFSRGDVADYVAALFTVYAILILLNILLQWLPRLPFYSPWLRAILDFITDTTDPYLNIFRRFIPSMGSGSFVFNIAPVVALVVLLVVEAIVVGVIDG